ncbi:hypothetical protein CUMW_138150, partial [Citrus unshiu]
SSSSSDPTFPKGLRSAVHVARVVKEAVDLTDEKAGIRWFVFGDGDAVFFVDNLVKTLSKYDDDRWFYVGSNSEGYEQNAKHSFDMTFGGGGFAISHRWFYVGSNSEGYEQNAKHSFDMTFGGGGFAISHSLARVLGRALDFCLMRYAHLYGSDARAFSCLVELGVGLNPEPSFHQKQALQHLFKAVNVDPAGILQQTVCYDESSLLTVSVAWGYAIQVYEGNQLLPDLLSLWRTFTSWRRGSNVESHFMFNLRDYPSDPFKRPIVFFLESVLSDNNSMQSNYVKHVVGNCARADLVRKMEKIRVFSEKLELDVEETMWRQRADFHAFLALDKWLLMVLDKACGTLVILDVLLEFPCCVNYKSIGCL